MWELISKKCTDSWYQKANN